MPSQSVLLCSFASLACVQASALSTLVDALGSLEEKLCGRTKVGVAMLSMHGSSVKGRAAACGVRADRALHTWRVLRGLVGRVRFGRGTDLLCRHRTSKLDVSCIRPCGGTGIPGPTSAKGS